MASPLISILMPVFNAQPWLNACLDSIIGQTAQHWELIAVDDHSTDNSLAILQAYAQKEPRIQALSHSSKGIIPALQTAFEHSRGQLITRMDADDQMATEKLEALKKLLLEKGPGHLATGFVQYISDRPLGNGYLRYEKWLNELTSQSDNYKDIYRECVIPSPCWMVYRHDLLQCGAFDPMIYPEDYDLCFRFYENKLAVLGVKKVLHYWRDHQHRTSRTSPTYADQGYFDLKLPYFLKLDYAPDQPLVLWGTGKKGKLLAKKLIAQDIPFHWITNNIKKQGVNIYNMTVQDYQILSTLAKAQIIIAVAAPDDQQQIKQYLQELPSALSNRLFYFC